MQGTQRPCREPLKAGYRKTFTSDLASDTQKAFKEGYEKAQAELEDKLENGELVSKEWHDEQILHAEDEIDRLESVIKEKDTLCFDCKKSVKEFAGKLKAKAFQGYQIGMYIIDTKTIDELLKEYDK